MIKINTGAVSKFFFVLPDYMRRSHSNSNKNGQSSTTLAVDEDGDLVLDRKPATEAAISIEHSIATELKLVGLQIWRGALLLADYVLAHPELFRDRHVLELGSGVGLDGIVASCLAREVCCTDIDSGTGILELIERNFKRNADLVGAKVSVCELDFLNTDWCPKLRSNDLRRRDHGWLRGDPRATAGRDAGRGGLRGPREALRVHPGGSRLRGADVRGVSALRKKAETRLDRDRAEPRLSPVLRLSEAEAAGAAADREDEEMTTRESVKSLLLFFINSKQNKNA
ncbi:unnamed protein product [Trichogramma brassicae]|uniref:Methyltransferase small domain-containing protein n=1 Tax=Trichogramma brassicae TaxID=86971 RepID=A0A6H5IVC6_9HYME|nr:unnamed protein product [Trichogramma brassicae]